MATHPSRTINHEGDILVRQVWMHEAGKLVWTLNQYTAATGQYALSGDYYWKNLTLEPYGERDDLISDLPDILAGIDLT